MIILLYNWRGLGNPRAASALKGIVEEKDPDVVFLSETKLMPGEMESIHQLLRYKNKIYVDCDVVGHHSSGGLAMFWKSHLQLSLCSSSIHYIDLENIGSEDEAI